MLIESAHGSGEMAHTDCHVREIVINAKATGRWTGAITVLAHEGREHVWQRALTPRERTMVCNVIADGLVQAQEADLTAEGPVVVLEYVGSWRAREVML